MRVLATLVVIGATLAPGLALAQSASDAQLLVRLQDLENTVRDLTGQLEKMQNTVNQLELEVQQAQSSDGGTGKKPITPPTRTTQPALPPLQPITPDTSTATLTATPGPTPLLTDQTPATGPAPAQSGDNLGQSGDPLVGKGGGTADLGTLPATGPNGPALNLNLSSSQPISNGDAEAQYKAGYDAITRGDYPFAEQQFKQFIQLYPKDPQAADATNWLAEALLQRQAYNDAANALYDGLKNYPDSPRVPDMLLKLGIAMNGAGEQDIACRAFFKLAKEYPKQPAAFLQRLQEEKTKAKCTV
jgi:tol-pal system protein YbgF